MASASKPVLGDLNGSLAAILSKKGQKRELAEFAINMAHQRMAIAALVNVGRAFGLGCAPIKLDPKLAAFLPLAPGVELTNQTLDDELQKRKATLAKDDERFTASLVNYGQRFGKRSEVKLAERIQASVDKVLATYPQEAAVHHPKSQVLLKKVTSGLLDLHRNIYYKYHAEKAKEKKPEEKRA